MSLDEEGKQECEGLVQFCLWHRPRLVRLALLFGIAFTLTVSSVGATGSSQFITTTCSILTSSRSSVLPRTFGTILFTCGPGMAAINVQGPGSATASFQLPKGYYLVSIVQHVSGSTSCNIGRILFSGYTVSFSTAGNFDYCLFYAFPPVTGLASFTITWSAQSSED